MGQKSKVLGVHVINPGMMLFGDNDNRQTDRHMYSRQKAQTYIKSSQIKWNRKANCQGFMYSIQE